MRLCVSEHKRTNCCTTPTTGRRRVNARSRSRDRRLCGRRSPGPQHSGRVSRLHSSVSQRSRGARAFVGPHPANRGDHSDGGQLRVGAPVALPAAHVRRSRSQGTGAGPLKLRRRSSVVRLWRVEFAGLAGLPLNCPRCGLPMRYLHAQTPAGEVLPPDAPPTNSTIYVYACSQHGAIQLGRSTPMQRDR